MSGKLQEVVQKQQEQKNVVPDNEENEILQLVGFVVGEEEFAIPILTIQEISNLLNTPEFQELLLMFLVFSIYEVVLFH